MPRTTKVNVSFDMDEERLNALNLYLAQNNQTLNDLLTDTLVSTTEKLYTRTVPKEVQSFLQLRNPDTQPEQPAPRRTYRRANEPENE